MTRIALPHLWMRPGRNGKRIAYYRRAGKATRIAGPAGKSLLPGDAGFLDSYQAIHRAHADEPTAPAPQSRSLLTLIALYRASDHFAAKAELTRAEYGRIMGEVEAQFGAKSVTAMELPHVLLIRKAFETFTSARGKIIRTPSRANKAVAVISVLMEFARGIGWRKDNPALKPKRLRTGDGYPTWTAEEFDQFMCHGAPSDALKRAAALAYYTGARVGDCIALPRAARKGGTLNITPAKTRHTTKARVVIPEHPELTRWLDAAPRSRALTLLTRQDGMPWKADDIKHAMTDAVRAVGLRAGLSFHGLRKGLTAALADSGATDAEIEAVIPHSDPRMTRHYRAAANQPKLAAAAMARLPKGKA